jgi:hypothetical protein
MPSHRKNLNKKLTQRKGPDWKPRGQGIHSDRPAIMARLAEKLQEVTREHARRER